MRFWLRSTLLPRRRTGPAVRTVGEGTVGQVASAKKVRVLRPVASRVSGCAPELLVRQRHGGLATAGQPRR